jgi:hypothetical protein
MTSQQRAQDPTAPAPAVAPDVSASVGGGGKPTSGSSSTSGRETADEQSPAQAFADVKIRVQELSEYAGYLISAKIDGIKLAVRNAGIYAALGVIGALAGGAFVVTLIVLLLRGIAGGLGVLFGGRFWLGELVTSVVFLALLGVGVFIVMGRLTKASRERTAKKYASRQQQQRARFGTDVAERAQRPGK